MSRSTNLRADAVVVDDSVTLIADGRTPRLSLTVRVIAGSDPVEIGGEGVAFGEGFPLSADEAYRFDDFNGPVYAICDAAGSAEVRLIEVGG